jgi:cytochrome P450
VAPKALAGRNRVQAILKDYYVKHLDEGDDVAAIIKNRAAIERRCGVPDDEIGLIEFAMPWVGTTNTIPTLFWFFVHVFSEPAYVARIRDEVQALTTITAASDGKGRVADIDITRLEKDCPMLHACYREALRLYSDMFGNRRVMADTIVRDPSDGREYLLRKGVNVQWVSCIPHLLQEVWGPDARDFNPERFVETPAPEEKKRRGAMIPFGGGRNLCPGRGFALAENLGLISALALGYEIEGASVPGDVNAYMGTAMRRPVWGDKNPGVRIKRRAGWEDVTWKFSC